MPLPSAPRARAASPTPLRVTGASEPAGRVLAAHGRRGDVRVAGRFDSSVSLDAGGWVVSASTTPVRLVCQVRLDEASMRRLRGLVPGSQVQADLTACPPLLPMRLVPAPRPLRPFRRPDSWFDGPDAKVLRPRLDAAARALVAAHADPQATSDALRGLLGLGAGLTPSGDDALVGMLAGLWATFGPPPATDAFGALLRQRPPLTTDTSLTYLRLACGGEFSLPVLHLVDALRTGSGVDHAVQQVAILGHSSGADLLAGLAAMLPGSRPASTA